MSNVLGTSCPDLRSERTPSLTSRTHQWAITVSAAVMLVATLAAVGLFGPRVEESAGGAFAADATLLTPAAWAFSIWSLIYALLVAYVVWQWVVPGNRVNSRIAWLVVGSMLLNAAWLVVARAGWVWLSVVVILALAVDLALLVLRLGERTPSSRVERIVVDGTFGVYLGWVSVASVANITTALVTSGVQPPTPLAELLAVVALALAAVLGGVYAFRFGGRWAIALAMSWALVAIAIGRLTGPLYSVATAVAALAAAGLILLLTGLARRRASISRPPQPAASMAASTT